MIEQWLPGGRSFGRRRRFRLLVDGYGYTGDPTVIRDAIIGRVERNVTMIRQLAGGVSRPSGPCCRGPRIWNGPGPR